MAGKRSSTKAAKVLSSTRAAKVLSSSKGAKVLTSRVVFRGPVFTVVSDKVLEPGGIRARRDVVRHSGSVVVLAVDETGREPRVLLERQYRYAAKQYLWELPAGRIDPGESERAGAQRELLEETGFTASSWTRALHFYVSPGFLDETMTIFLARGLRKGKAQPEEDEVIRLRFWPLSAALKMIATHRIRDAKTITGLLWFSCLQNGGKPRR